MKRFLFISLTFLLAIVITYAGSGINAYSFCCDDCYTYGLEAIVADKCCDTHHNEFSSEQVANDNAASMNTHEHCSLERLDMDLQSNPTEQSQTQISVEQLDITFTTLLYQLNRIELDETITGYVSQTQKPPNLSNLVYFSLLETLII